MKYIRSFLMVFSFVFYGIGSIFFNFLVFPFAKIILKENNFIIFSSNLIRNLWSFFIKYIELIGLIKVNVKDIEKLKNIKNKVIVATHPSYIDILILMSIIPKSTCFVKNKLKKNFFLNNIVNSIFISNDLEIDELKNETEKYLNKDFNIIIFPTGRRHRKDERAKIKKGASLIAINSKKNIVPVKIETSRDFLYINKPFYDAGEKTVDFNIEILDEIEIVKYNDESEIKIKRNITNEISKRLYC